MRLPAGSDVVNAMLPRRPLLKAASQQLAAASIPLAGRSSRHLHGNRHCQREGSAAKALPSRGIALHASTSHATGPWHGCFDCSSFCCRGFHRHLRKRLSRPCCLWACLPKQRRRRLKPRLHPCWQPLHKAAPTDPSRRQQLIKLPKATRNHFTCRLPQRHRGRAEHRRRQTEHRRRQARHRRRQAEGLDRQTQLLVSCSRPFTGNRRSLRTHRFLLQASPGNSWQRHHICKRHRHDTPQK